LKNLSEAHSQKHSTWKKLGFLVLLGVAVYLILPQITVLEHSWQVLTTLIPWAVGLAIVAQGLSYLGSGYLLQTLLGLTHQPVKIWRSTLIFLGSASVGMVAGGSVGNAAAIFTWTNRDNQHPEGATLGSLLPPIFNDLILMLISIIGLAHLLIAHDLSRAQLIGFSAIVFILGMVIGMAILALRHRDRVTTMVVWAARRLARFRRKPFDPEVPRNSTRNLLSAWDALKAGAWRGPVLGAVLNVVFDMLTLYFLFLAAGHGVSLGVLLTGYGLPLLLGKVVFVIPGGVGVVEGSMATLYAGLGVPSSIAVVVVLAYRFISFWLPSLSGFPIAAYLQREKGNPQKP
jgi:uncharacterized protein (TIRG00374 family)